ncbi:hypothetical protein GF345_05090 [Candidatus Woesearchaeota archaeon]|nr:hypothetical protein [Candidatus Woesearchaeota archaeon]
MANEGEVRTDVDRLLELVKQSKEISVDEAAKKLGVPANTIESLSDLLEEEGMLHIKYKFTTPYLTSEVPKGKGEKKKPEELVVEKEEEKAEVKVPEGSKKEIKDMGKAKLSPEKKVEPEKKTVHAKEITTEQKPGEMGWPEEGKEEKEEEKEEGKEEEKEKEKPSPEEPEAKPEQPEAKPEAPEAKPEEPEISIDAEKITTEQAKPGEKITPEPLKKKDGLEIPETDDIDILIKKANEFIARGDFESARKIYLRIRKIKDEIPEKFIEKEKKAESGLVDLNKNLMGGIDKALSTDFNKKISEIESLFNKVEAHMRSGQIQTLKDLEFIENTYHEIKELYLSLPAGFMEKKVSIQDRMLQLYRNILTSKKNILSTEFSKKSESIVKLMDRLVKEISSRKINEANRTFTEITHLYRTLPRGFLKEKTDLQNRILSMYQKLIVSKEEVYTKDLKHKSEMIKDMIHEAMADVSKGRLGKAQALYRRITEMYAKLPEGFYDIRADLEMKILDLHHLIVLKHSRATIDDMNSKSNEIETLIQSANNYLKDRETDLAKEAYQEATSIYNTFPEGFIDVNLKIRDKIVKLYKDILSQETRPLIGEVDRQTEKIYVELLKLLVNIHDLIKKKQFDKIKDKYMLAYKLYHELPLNFLEKKTSLYSELFKYYEELKLYSEVMKLSEYANNNEYGKLKDLLSLVIDTHSKLIRKYPEDIEIFRFIHGKCLIYMDLLKRGMKAKNGRDVREKVQGMAEKKKKPEIEKSKELKEHEKGKAAKIPIEQTMPGVHPASTVHAETKKPQEKEALISAKDYLQKKYHPLG